MASTGHAPKVLGFRKNFRLFVWLRIVAKTKKIFIKFLERKQPQFNSFKNSKLFLLCGQRSFFRTNKIF